MVALFFLNEIRAGDGCPWTLDIDVVVERLEMAWLPGRVVCRSFNLETGVERVTTQRFTQLYFLPLSSLVPILSLVALRRSRAKA